MMSPHAEVAFTRCAAETISPLARRIVAIDGGYGRPAGLRTYLVGRGDVALIDPDPASGPLMQAILEATEGERITHVLISHGHGRRSPLGAQLAERFGADVVSGAMGLRDGERVYGLDWTLEALETPGHTPDHFAFALAEEQSVFCGDLVSGWSPDVVTPPGGDLTALLASIERIRREGFRRLLPAHGPPIADVDDFLCDCLADARRREQRIVALVSAHGPASAWQLAAHTSPAPRGVGAADAHAIFAHLARLAERGDLISKAPLSLFAPFKVKTDPGPRNGGATIATARRATWDRCPIGISDSQAAAR
jgi:glyoxylase-like metal-dependent hydrolase (beta-lactamase superfamily II)